MDLLRHLDPRLRPVLENELRRRTGAPIDGIPRGVTVVLAGHRGAGKTTVLPHVAAALGLAEVVEVRPEGGSVRVTFRAPEALARFIAPKGSVALNGTSLTVNEVAGSEFGVNFIPHTQSATTWGEVSVGDKVNLEVDTMARYVARLREYD